MRREGIAGVADRLSPVLMRRYRWVGLIASAGCPCSRRPLPRQHEAQAGVSSQLQGIPQRALEAHEGEKGEVEEDLMEPDPDVDSDGRLILHTFVSAAALRGL